MSHSSTNTNKNFYGKRRRKQKVPNRLFKQINQVITQKEMREIEMKTRDKEHTGNAGIGAAGVVLPLTDPQEGTGNEELIGSDFLVKSLLVRYQIYVADTFNTTRTIIFRWKCNSIPVVADILQDYVTGLVAGPLSPLKLDNKKMIQVLYSNMWALDTNENQTSLDKVYIKRDMKVQYNESGSKGYGHIYMLIVTDSAAISHPAYTVISRCKYTDA